jgi:hypothetical protein
MRLGENAIFRLAADPLVVRISREAARLPVARRELCVARWLGSGGVPAVRVADEVRGQPLMVGGHPVSFWKLADGVGLEPSQKDLARLLKMFHALEDCPCDLPEFNPFPVSRNRIEHATAIGEKDQEFLLGVCDEAEEILAGLDFALPRGAIHGDAHVANLLADRGRVVLLDFESSVLGPREWDLLPAAVGVDRFGRDESTYRDFTEAYGFDVREWAGYPKLRRVRELTMTTWMAQNAGNSEKLHAEAKRRISSLREGEFTSAWSFF